MPDKLGEGSPCLGAMGMWENKQRMWENKQGV